MERRRTFARRARLGGVALLVLSVATGCSGGFGDAAAATVDGQDISAAAVARQVQAQEDLVRVQAKQAGTKGAALAEQLSAFRGAGADTLPVDQSARGLSQLVRVEVLRRAVADNDGKVTEDQRKAAKTDLEGQVTQAGLKMADLPSAFVDTQVELLALQAALAKSVTVDDATLRKAYEEQKDSLAQMCVSLLVAADQPAAQAAMGRIEAGEDFAAVSTDVSIDEELVARGGEAGCAPPTTVAQSLGPDLLTAQVGELVGPTETANGWLVATVTSNEAPSFEDAKGQLETTASEGAVQEAILAASRGADVTVSSRFGTWDPETATVVPPVDPGATTTTAPALTPVGP